MNFMKVTHYVLYSTKRKRKRNVQTKVVFPYVFMYLQSFILNIIDTVRNVQSTRDFFPFKFYVLDFNFRFIYQTKYNLTFLTLLFFVCFLCTRVIQ